VSKSNAYESDSLRLLFNATPIPGIADNAASAPLLSLYVALHTADPGEGGDQTTSEATYAGYARVAVARTAGGWTVTGSSASPTAPVAFPACAGGAETITHWSVGAAASGAGKIFYSGTVTPNIPVAVPVAPQITTASAITED
jgi:hypothetical protein